MVKKIGMVIVGATLVVAHCLIGGAAFADSYTQDGKPCPPECVSDSMEIETYYPSPYGYYEELRGDKIIVGDTDNSRIDETHLPPSGTITFEPMLDDPDSSDGSLYEGSLYYQGAIGGTKGKFRLYDGSAWQDLGGSEFWKASTTVSSNIYTDKSVKFGSYSTAGRPTCNADTLGSVIFDTSKNNLYLCKSGGAWEPVGGYSYTQSFTTPGTYTFVVPNGITEIMIEAWSAGGGGGGGNGRAGSGSGGSGGGSSSVGSLIFASGGNGGSGGCCGFGGGNGGTSSAPISISGQNGTSGGMWSGGGGGGVGGFGAGNGGSGGGYGTNSSGSGGGGGGGAYGKGTFNVTSGTPYTIVVGAGGTGGSGGTGCYSSGSCVEGGGSGTTGGNGKVSIYY